MTPSHAVEDRTLPGETHDTPHNCVYPGMLAFYNELDAGHVQNLQVHQQCQCPS